MRPSYIIRYCQEGYITTYQMVNASSGGIIYFHLIILLYILCGGEYIYILYIYPIYVQVFIAILQLHVRVYDINLRSDIGTSSRD